MQATQQLTYRLYKEKDLTGIISLWANYSGWGAITEQEFNDWYINTPYGSCPVVVAENESNEIVGQLSLIPTAILIDGKEIKGLRISAPVLHEDFRLHDLRSMDHPAFLMIKHAIEQGKEMGYSILYALPALGWLGLLKLFPRFGLPDIKTSSFGCVAISLSDDSILQHISKDNIAINVVNSFDESFNELWKEASISFPIHCGIIRNSQRNYWKISHHLVFEIKQGNRLIGYAAYKKEDGLLVDILARNPDELKTVLLSSIMAMHKSSAEKVAVNFDEIKLMCAPQMSTIINIIPHKPVNFQFAFGCYPLVPFINDNSILPENWYIMPCD